MKLRFFLLGLLLPVLAAAQQAPPEIPPAPPLPSLPAMPTGIPRGEGEASPREITSADWPGVEYSEVRAYLYNPGDNRKNLILQEGKLHPEVANPEGIKLTAEQVDQLLKAAYREKPDHSGSGCFRPHHGIVFYDQKGKPVADITICFLCEIVVAEPSGPDTLHWNRKALAKLMLELGLPVFKELDEANTHFTDLARKWPDAKLKAAIDECILRKPNTPPLYIHDRAELLRGVGERSHAVLLAYLADKTRRAEWLTKADPSDPFSHPPFHWLCDLFGDTPPAAAVPLLAGFLDEQDKSVRCDAAQTIALTGMPESVPLVRRALADPEEYVRLSALEGLLVAGKRGALQAGIRDTLFDEASKLGPNHQGVRLWVKALIAIDREKALGFFARDEIFRSDNQKLDEMLDTLSELKMEVPRRHLLGLILAEGKDFAEPPAAAFLLLGRQHHPDDLKLLQKMTADDSKLARPAMQGLLAWHGLEDYRKRLKSQEDEQGFAAMSEVQRFLFAADEFASDAIGTRYYLSSTQGEHWQTALAGLKAAKQDEMATALEEAAKAFGDEVNSPDPKVRRMRYENPKNLDTFSELEKRREKLGGRCELALDRYAIEHAESFK